jgi:hypothetical protein
LICNNLKVTISSQKTIALSLHNIIIIMGFLDRFKKDKEKSKDSENREAEQEEMKEEQHQLDLKENYESDEEFEESKD